MTDTTPPISEVVTAAAKAMAAIRKVGKEGRNQHDNYNFASIDDFLAMVNPICAEAGLIFPMQEDGIEDFTRKGKFGENTWMRVRWQITVMHVSGQSLPPVLRTVEVLRNGAQAYGSAQSYALKQFLRSFLLIPTGDKDDADLQPTDDGQIERAPNPAQVMDEMAAFTRAVTAAITAIGREETLDGLGMFWADLAKSNRAVSRDAAVIAEKNKRKAEFEATAKEKNKGERFANNLLAAAAVRTAVAITEAEGEEIPW